jgi:two-component system chemotaxis response regulator CheB
MEARVRQNVNVMIVDDSALMRKLLGETLTRDPGIHVVDTAMDGQFALDHLAKVRPDVVLLDLEMPRLDGLETLDRIVALYGLPVVMCSTKTTSGGEATLDALNRGAVDFIEKPTLQALKSGEAARAITDKIHAAAGARVRRPPRPPAPSAAAPPPPPVPPPNIQARFQALAALSRRAEPEMVAIGTSTGGPQALEQVLAALPGDFPLGIAVVQHMPVGFTALLAARLDRCSRIRVREAAHGDRIEPGLALVGPGGRQMRIVRRDGRLVVSLEGDQSPVSGHVPSVDVLMSSVASSAGGRAVAVVMTGMGSDGADGMAQLSSSGAVTIAQSPDSCVCFGMPKSVIERGHARAEIPLSEIAPALVACAVRPQRPN